MQVCNPLNQNMEKIYHSSDGFLMLRVQNVCVESIFIFWHNLWWYCHFNPKWMRAWSYLPLPRVWLYLGKQRWPWWDAHFAVSHLGLRCFYTYVPFLNAFSPWFVISLYVLVWSCSACAAPGSFVRGGPTLTFFLFVFFIWGWREDPNTTISGSSSAHQQNAI